MSPRPVSKQSFHERIPLVLNCRGERMFRKSVRRSPADRRNGTCRPLSTFVMTVKHAFREALTQGGVFTSRPSAFLILAAFTVGWIVLERETFDWHGVATLVTWAMTLFTTRRASRHAGPASEDGRAHPRHQRGERRRRRDRRQGTGGDRKGAVCCSWAGGLSTSHFSCIASPSPASMLK